MSINVPTHFFDQYNATLRHMLQIAGGKYRPHVTEAMHSGESAVAIDLVGEVHMTEVVARNAPMPSTDAEMDRVWVYPADYEVSQKVATFDKLRLMQDPTSALVQAAYKESMRQMDEVISDAFYASRKTGRAGATTVAFDTTNHRVDAAIGAAADTGLNVEKLIATRELFQENNVDLDYEMPCIAITPGQEADLLRQAQVIDSAISGKPFLKDGRIDQWLGFKFIISNIVPSNSSYRLCPAWVPSGMHLGIWKDFTSEAGIREDISGRPYQLYGKMTFGATAVEPGRIIQIECTE